MIKHIENRAVAVLDFGSQYSQLITRRVREASVYCELFPYNTPEKEVMSIEPAGFVLSGGPASVYQEGAPRLPYYVLKSGKPILGVCYGMQLLAYHSGGGVAPASEREYGPAQVHLSGRTVAPIFASLRPHTESISVWMSHGDRITSLPPGFAALASSENSPIAAMGDVSRGYYGLQFHPEVSHTPLGREIIGDFLFNVCGCSPSWTPGSFIDGAVQEIRGRVGEGRVVCALSGGVDSSVTALLLHRAIAERLACIFIDNGLLRLGEPEQVRTTFGEHFELKLTCVDAAGEFLSDLEGVTDPEEKRRRIGARFIRLFEKEARSLGEVGFLAQGTLYPDVIESTAPDRSVATKIKSHHNVGGLPPDMQLELIEPLRYLFKDEARRVGLELGLPEEIVWRHPFPGPGLAVRVIGEVTRERLDTLRAADSIFVSELRLAGLYREVSQALAVLLPIRSVGVMGDDRTYENVVALRAVTTEDFMTADWARLPGEFLARVSNRIVNEVGGVNRVVYDVSSKPPATIEWE